MEYKLPRSLLGYLQLLRQAGDWGKSMKILKYYNNSFSLDKRIGFCRAKSFFRCRRSRTLPCSTRSSQQVSNTSSNKSKLF
jgi:hypothetical protein